MRLTVKVMTPPVSVPVNAVLVNCSDPGVLEIVWLR